MDISVTHLAKDEGLADPRYTQPSQLVKRRGKLGLSTLGAGKRYTGASAYALAQK
jgi:hypothetical protein